MLSRFCILVLPLRFGLNELVVFIWRCLLWTICLGCLLAACFCILLVMSWFVCLLVYNVYACLTLDCVHFVTNWLFVVDVCDGWCVVSYLVCFLECTSLGLLLLGLLFAGWFWCVLWCLRLVAYLCWGNVYLCCVYGLLLWLTCCFAFSMFVCRCFCCFNDCVVGIVVY